MNPIEAFLRGDEKQRQAVVQFATGMRRAERFRAATATVACEEYDASAKTPEDAGAFVSVLRNATNTFDRAIQDAFSAMVEVSLEGIDVEAIKGDLISLHEDGVIENAAGLAVDPDTGELGFLGADGDVQPLSEADPRMLRVMGRLAAAPGAIPEGMLSPNARHPLEQINDALIELGEPPIAPIGGETIEGFAFEDIPVAEKPEGAHAAFERYLAEREGVRDFDGQVE